jgi:acetyl esterase/lipase
MMAVDEALDDIDVDDIDYYSHASGVLIARLYRPKHAEDAPALVSVHGGRWVRESRLTNAVIDEALAQAGAVVMAIDFRMPPLARYPDCVADINVAIRWLKRHAEQFGARPERVGGLGTSSGGHQLMLNAMRPRDPRYASLPLEGGFDASLAFVVLGWPVVDPLARYLYAKTNDKAAYLDAHHAYWPGEADMAEGNPQLILARGEKALLPPTLLIQGTADVALTPDMADAFASAYAKAGGRITLRKFAGEPHTFVTKTPASLAARKAIEMIKAFVAELP